MCCWTSSWSSVVFGSRSAFFLEIPVPCAFCVASDFWMAALMVSWGNQSIDVRLLSSSDVILNEVTDGQACPYKPIWPQRESQATQAGTARPSLRPLRASPFPAKGPNGALRERPRAYETKLGVVAWKLWLGIGCKRPPRCGGDC